MRRVILILATLLLIGAAISCDGDSVAAAKLVVQSFYEAVNDGDTAKAQSYIAPGQDMMIELTDAMVSCMAGKIQKVEIVDTLESEGTMGSPPYIGVFVTVSCAPEVPTYAPGYPQTTLTGRTCGDLEFLLYEFESGWKIHGIF